MRANKKGLPQQKKSRKDTISDEILEQYKSFTFSLVCYFDAVQPIDICIRRDTLAR